MTGDLAPDNNIFIIFDYNKMRKKKVTLIIEASSTGFGIYGEDFPVTAYGETIEAAKKDLDSAIADVLDFCKKEGKDPDPALNSGDLEFLLNMILPVYLIILLC